MAAIAAWLMAGALGCQAQVPGAPRIPGQNPNGMRVFMWTGLKTHASGQHDYPQFLAGELEIAPKTASAHVEHILAKLGVARRAEIAAWVANVARPMDTAAATEQPALARR